MIAGGARQLFLGLISGTSADGIDAAVVDLDGGARVLAATTTRYPEELRSAVLAMIDPRALHSLDRYGEMDVAVANAFADAARSLLDRSGIAAKDIRAIGTHGQTVRHRPHAPLPFTLQIGDPNVIAERTGIVTVGDFRRRDVAAGGQGAPLVPAFHAAMFSAQSQARAVLNLGGIANVTLLPGTHAPIRGFDTGPANCLLDLVAGRCFGLPHDAGGALAASGRMLPARVDAALADPYFRSPPPKSTGREYFDWTWLESVFGLSSEPPENVMASLVEISARSIVDSIAREQPGTVTVYACGGGVHNRALMDRLAQLLGPTELVTTSALGIDPDFVEAAAFAWLAARTLAGLPGNLPEATGARGPRILGTVFPA